MTQLIDSEHGVDSLPNPATTTDSDVGNTTPSREGTIRFHHPSIPLTTPCHTWYRVFGDLSAGSTPLIVLHGGPGACHNYLVNLSLLSTRFGVPVIFYDQLGNGLSTHLREKRLDTDFWTPELFLAELDNLLRHFGLGETSVVDENGVARTTVKEYDLLGQSWGGMMGSTWACRQPKGLNRLVISNSPASMKLWVESCRVWIATLPEWARKAINEGEERKKYDSKEYEEAVLLFYKKHMCRIWPFPADAQASLEWLTKDDTVYRTMNGPSEFTVIGNLKDWDVQPDLYKIDVPTLVLNGEYDEARDSCVYPFFQGIKKCKWYTFPGCSHMSNVEDLEAYVRVVGGFLRVADC